MFVGPLVLDKDVKFHDPSFAVLEKFPQKPSEAVYSTVFPYNFRPEEDDDVIYPV